MARTFSKSQTLSLFLKYIIHRLFVAHKVDGSKHVAYSEKKNDQYKFNLTKTTQLVY